MSTYRPASAFVHGADAPCVVVPGRVAAWLENHADLRRLRTRARGLDAEVDAVLLAVSVVATSWRASVGATEPRKATKAEAPSQWMTAQQVADQLKITASRVRQECRTGRLEATNLGAGRGWQITREAFEHYRTARANRAA